MLAYRDAAIMRLIAENRAARERQGGGQNKAGAEGEDCLQAEGPYLSAMSALGCHGWMADVNVVGNPPPNIE
jgi:hypothetical protein